jgi:hypothetical protein
MSNLVSDSLGGHMRSVRKRGRAAAKPLFAEPLEARLLMAADYSLAFTSDTLTSEAVFGFKATGTAKLVLTTVLNQNFSAADKANIRVVARPATAVDESQDIELGKLLNQGIGIAVDKTKTFTVPLALPAGTAVGEYLLIATADMTVGGARLGTATAQDGVVVEPQTFDLHATFNTVTAPTTQTSGGGTVNTFQVKLTNDGNIAAPAGETAAIQLFLRPVGEGADVPLPQTSPVSIANLKPGASKLVTLKTALPISVASGDYTLVAVATAAGPQAETDPDNNVATSNQTVTVTQGVLDYQTTVGTVSLPPAIVAGVAAGGSVQVKLTNKGTVTTGAAEKLNVQLVARPTGGGADVPLTAVAAVSFGNVKPNAVKTVTLKPAFAASLPAGTYEVVAVASSAVTAVDTNAANDSAVAGTVTVAAPFVDLTGVDATTTLAASVAGGAKGTVTVTVKNQGNVVATGYKVEIFAITGETIPDNAVPVGTTTSATGKINPGATAKVAVSVTLPSPNLGTAYTLVARITHADDVDTSNNEGNVGTVSVVGSAFLGQLLTTYRLTQTHFENNGGFQITSGGTVRDADGNAVGGGYSYIVTNLPISVKMPATFEITGPGGTTAFQLTFNGAVPNSLDGKTIVFQKSSAGSSGKVHVVANPAAGIPADIDAFFKLI